MDPYGDRKLISPLHKKAPTPDKPVEKPPEKPLKEPPEKQEAHQKKSQDYKKN